MRIKNWLSQHLTAGISLYVLAVWMFLLPSVSMGVVLDQGDAPSQGQGAMPAFQQPNAATFPYQKNAPG